MRSIQFGFAASVLLALTTYQIAIAQTPNKRPVDTTKATVGNINLLDVKQIIRGFGGVNAWKGELSDKDMSTLYGNDGPDQYGFSIYRVRIAPGGDTSWGVELANAKKAIAHGKAMIMASPWTPPAYMKTNNALIHGSLKPSSYADYAAYLKKFADYMKHNGAKLYAMSIQNEPDVKVKYESCDWTAAEMRDFLSNYGGSMGYPKIIAAEHSKFTQSMTDSILDDQKAAAHVDIVGGHLYGRTTKSSGLNYYAKPFIQGKEVWMTEHLVNNTDWKGALNTGKEINDCMTVGNYSIYMWWFLKRFYGPIGEKGETTKRGYVMAQFSKYIRPGYHRVATTDNPTTNVFMSAYKGQGKVVIVALNMSDSPITQQFSIDGGKTPAIFTPHVTSNDKNNTTEAIVNVSEKMFNYILPAKSITTFVSN